MRIALSVFWKGVGGGNKCAGCFQV